MVHERIAILYQAELPPLRDGIRKPMKEGGYSDSGADIAYALSDNDLSVVTQSDCPDIHNDIDWVFPDTPSGIDLALAKGANIFWLNTVLHKDHPITKYFDQGLYFIGQDPHAVDIYDDKVYTNSKLMSLGIPVPENELITRDSFNASQIDMPFPLVLKPIRGRGSQGVQLIYDKAELEKALVGFFEDDRYGDKAYIERYLPGQEITITVMPAGFYVINGKQVQYDKPWCLPAVKRINHVDGIAPYSGKVAVMLNSTVMSDDELSSPDIQEACLHCTKTAEFINIKAPIRIDCRANERGQYLLFDINLKPNMTGPSRPHRMNQDSLSLLAARKMGWEYFEFLNNILNQKW